MLKLASAIFTTGFAVGAATVALAVQQGRWPRQADDPIDAADHSDDSDDSDDRASSSPAAVTGNGDEPDSGTTNDESTGISEPVGR